MHLVEVAGVLEHLRERHLRALGLDLLPRLEDRSPLLEQLLLMRISYVTVNHLLNLSLFVLVWSAATWPAEILFTGPPQPDGTRVS